jgi:hypothetical protein
LRLLQDPELLHETVAVTPRREPEVPLEQRLARAEFRDQVRAAQARISARMACAAATGSGAAVIGRPTTR